MTIKQLKNTALNLNEARIVNALAEHEENIDALNGEIVESLTLSRNSNDGVFVQIHKENGTTVTSQSLGIEVWETIDLDNMPTNFAEGQELLITFLPSAVEKTVTNWTTAFTDNPTMQNQTLQNTIRVRLATGTTNGAMIQSIRANSTAVVGVELVMCEAGYFNGDNTMMMLTPFCFNGAGLQEGTGVSIMRSNITSYVESIKRKL